MAGRSPNWLTVAARSALEPGSVRGVKIGELDVAIYNIDGGFYATDNICPHAYARLSEGWLEGEIVECPLHGGQFEVKTGKGLGSLITCDIKIFAVRVAGDDIQIEVEA